jgi:hypothetical protein
MIYLRLSAMIVIQLGADGSTKELINTWGLLLGVKLGN